MKCADFSSSRQQGIRGCTIAYLCVLLSLSVTGCAEDTGRIPFSGRIEGLENFQGTISFRPTSEAAGLPATSERVHNGNYSFTRENGPFPGDYTIIIERQVPLTKGAAAQNVSPQQWRFQRTVPGMDQRDQIKTDFTLDDTTLLTTQTTEPGEN